VIQEAYTLSDITETGDDSDLTGEHDIGGSLDTIDEGLSASVLQVSIFLRQELIELT
jgi:hypothetical protein